MVPFPRKLLASPKYNLFALLKKLIGVILIPLLKLFLSYIVALVITILLAFIDNDPINNYYSIMTDVFLIWGLGLLMYGVKLLS